MIRDFQEPKAEEPKVEKGETRVTSWPSDPYVILGSSLMAIPVDIPGLNNYSPSHPENWIWIAIWVWVNTYRYISSGMKHPFTSYFGVHGTVPGF